ncbi:MAG: hypothetical protein HC767_07080 [Akkermansiaceae bacterium]|nr:hypothetical protein [Akkermansiaceae bacterium]
MLLEELAADTFELAFAGKFAIAARHAARALKGTAYERYYGLDYSEVLARIACPAFEGSGEEFCLLCEELCGLSDAGRCYGGRGWGGRGMRGMGGRRRAHSTNQMRKHYVVSQKAMIIEQAQIITTHNLAMLREAGAYERGAAGGWGALAMRCAKAVCTQTGVARAARQNGAGERWARQATTAWRHMVFFLALEEDRTVQASVVKEFAKAKPEVRWVLEPKLKRLQAALDGKPLCVEKYGEPLVGFTVRIYRHRFHRLLNRYD